jgi:allantoinase
MLQYQYRPNAPPTPRSRAGSDRDWSPYSAIVDRPVIRWPGGARVALWLCPNVLHYEFMPPHNAWLDPWARMGPPDVLGFGRQEYGNRAGFWRMLEVLDRRGSVCTAIVNVSALERFPEICRAIVERRWDIAGHGACNTRFIYGYDEAAERAYYLDQLERVERLTGVRMKGMGGAGPQVGTERTPDLLAECGFLYHTDWFHDDQPAPLRVRSGRLISMPYAVEINDASVIGGSFEADTFLEIAKRQFDRLYAEGAENGRILCIALHGHIVGQPQRIGYLERALDYIGAHEGVWHATGAEIAEYYMRHYHDDALARLT